MGVKAWVCVVDMNMDMDNRPSWEDSQYRCQICMQILSNELTSDMCPQVVCDNIHTVCKKCTEVIRRDQAPKCPQCRLLLRKDDVANRDVIFLLSIAAMRCGACDSQVEMSCATAQKHSKECSENHITCPLLNNDMILSQCTQSMSVSTLWEHCQQFHASGQSHGVSVVNAVPCENNLWTAMLTISVTFERNHYSFFTITTPHNKYNMCLHMSKDMSDAVRTDPKIAICVRRFFPETELTFHRKIISVEIGSMCGILLPIPAVVSSYEDITSLKKLDTQARMQKIIELPTSLLLQMLQYDDTDTVEVVNATSTLLPEARTAARGIVTRLKVAVSVQFWFEERAKTLPDEPEHAP